MLNRADVIELAADKLWPALQKEQTRLAEIDLWYRWQHEDQVVPKGATTELKSLLQLAKTPWPSLVVTTVAQAMYVDGYRTPDSEDNETPWDLWQANDLDGRQIAVHRSMLAYGTSYVTILPGKNPVTGDRTAVLRGVSPQRMLAFYEDPAEDDWPVYVIRADRSGDQYRLRIYDDDVVYSLSTKVDAGSTDRLKYLGESHHGTGFCPVSRFTNNLDLDGRADGEVEPLIALAKRIDKTAYDRLLTQHFSSWKVRTVAGMAEPDDEESANRAKLKLRQDDLLIAEDPDTKFGTLAETPLDGFIKAYETDIKTLAAVSQTPVYSLVGDMINVGVEGLAAARASHDAKIAERRKSAGKSWDQSLKAGALITGDIEAARDAKAHVTWEDTSIRSLAEAADAYGKMATMLGIPPQGLWSMLPGVSRTDVEGWRALAAKPGAVDRLADALERQGQPA